MDWRAQLVSNLRVLYGHLAEMGITEVFVDGSFCSDKDRPGDIDGYFITDFPAWLRQQQELIDQDEAWDLRKRMPDAEGKPKPLLWHRYHVEMFPVFRLPFTHYSAAGGDPPVTIDRFFHRTRDGQERGVVQIVPEEQGEQL